MTVDTDFIQEEKLFGPWSQSPIDIGIGAEQIQRAAKVQIIEHLPSITEQLQSIWNQRDKEFTERIDGSYKPTQIPKIENSSFYTGTKHISVLKAELNLWPFVVIYSSDAKAYTYQADQFDTHSIPLCIEAMCVNGPINSENELHTKRGWEVEQELDSMVQRLSDAIHMCIEKDRSLGGVNWAIEKPPNATTSLPWSRKESGPTETGKFFIFQGKQLEYTVQRNSF